MPSQPTPAFLAHVAANVRARRLAAGLSQTALSKASGVSLRMIGAIEGGSTSVSTATLDRIGLALDATLVDLVQDPALPRSTVVNRLGWRGEHGGEGVLMSSIEARREVETWSWTLQPGERYEAGADPAGWHVQLFVVEGRLTLELADGPVEISADAYLFDSAQPHAFGNRGDRLVRFFRTTIC
ncbi:helix-turn-helix domain-containing protein [Caulobacter endophyticus]|uniref:helix-turn-helix domain-containing protein n=1 Tax=Caulobacter endophyticus TaxID=2172652 RepID=UPI002410A1A7|nr:XRE family transcriptional regulator [Caulobacter endophyticus]MDG2527338.1 XRE family transcriptional regulator [Caulobacter endophyticus]